jgi:putative tricarboxylic transport membrane protein
VWAKLLRIPRPQLYAGILFFAALGAYATNLQAFDLFLLLVLGLLGLMMRRFALPVLPLILGVILGPLMELKLREAMAISGGEVDALWSEPLAIVIYVVVAVAIVAPIVLRTIRPAPAAVAVEEGLTATDTREEENVR